MSDELRATIARAISDELGIQDRGQPFPLGDDLKLEWLDQGETDLGKVADRILALIARPTDDDVERAARASAFARRSRYDRSRGVGHYWENLGWEAQDVEIKSARAALASLHDRG